MIIRQTKRAALWLAISLSCHATVVAADNALPSVDFAAQGHAQAANDLAQAEVYAEVTGPDPQAVAKEVNARIRNALELAAEFDKVKTQTASTGTWPVYGKNTRSIEGWRMRTALSLESRDVTAMSELLGRMQSLLAIGQLNLIPAPETLLAAEDAATLAALKAFGNRAEMVAKALGKHYRIKTLNIGTQRMPPPVFRASAANMAMEAASAPIEAGQSDVVIQVNGTIELTD